MSELTIRDDEHLSLRDRLRLKKNAPVLLLDVSGSMSEWLEPNRTKIDALKDIVNNINVPVELFAFSSHVEPVTKDSIGSPRGGTRLSPALKELIKRNKKDVVIITDGNVELHDQTESLDLAMQGFSFKILYVGLGEPPDFLKQLGKFGSGFCKKEDLKFTKELTDKVIKLLTTKGGL